ncbi:5613_t:CDS:2 [Scutellospora calospora]|uniref:5613_t:CDS:1 n=1 Tax=Scutellospora calospora TaxID=85575 RepID=A0ACA9LWD6_9GLOM|nr:5613_t:CDS:2 [Scutellospora calospora]
MTETFFNDVVEDFKKLYETREDYDAVIIAGEEPNVKEIRVHSLILRTRSLYFRSAFSANWAERTNGNMVLKKPNISALTIEIILKYLYYGTVDFKTQEKDTILELLVAADELGIQRLIDSVQEFLIKNCHNFLLHDSIKMLDIIIRHEVFDKLKDVSLKTFTKNCQDLLQKNIIKLLHFITRHEALNKLKEVSLETISKNPNILFNSDEFNSLEEEVLILILKCNKLDMKEGDIWKQLVKWGISQHSTLNSNVKNFTHENFNTLEQTLHGLIQLVRFHQMDREEFMHEVWPFRNLLPDYLIEDILRCYLVSGVVPLYHKFQIRWGNIKIDSGILINKEIVQLFEVWIGNQGVNYYDLNKIQYDYKLLFRSSVDGGFSSQAFHQKCDNKGATIFVGKILNSNQLVGGYNPIDWNGNGIYKNTTESFLFSLNDLYNSTSSTLGRVNQSNGSNAVYCHPNYGLTFGSGHDLYAPNNSNAWQLNANSYTSINISGSITISDFEVFQVVKKI